MEEFRDHWFNQHGKIFSSLTIVKKNVLKYEQVSSALLSLRRFPLLITVRFTVPPGDKRGCPDRCNDAGLQLAAVGWDDDHRGGERDEDA